MDKSSTFRHIYGDQAKYFDLELKPRIKHRTKGTISFVNNGNDMHGSQVSFIYVSIPIRFFLCFFFNLKSISYDMCYVHEKNCTGTMRFIF